MLKKTIFGFCLFAISANAGFFGDVAKEMVADSAKDVVIEKAKKIYSSKKEENAVKNNKKQKQQYRYKKEFLEKHGRG